MQIFKIARTPLHYLILIVFCLIFFCCTKKEQKTQVKKHPLDNFDPGDYSLGDSIQGKIRENTKDPEPIIGYEKFNKLLKDDLKYPELAKKAGKEGKVLVEIMVDAKGDVFIMDKWGFGFGSEEEAIRLIKSAGKWKPAIDLDKKLTFAMSVMIQVDFNLR